MEIEIGRGKKARRAYGFDDVAIVPSAGNVADSVRVTLPAGANLKAVRTVAAKALPDLAFSTVALPSGPALQGTLTTKQIRDRQDYAIEQNLVNLQLGKSASY